MLLAARRSVSKRVNSALISSMTSRYSLCGREREFAQCLAFGYVALVARSVLLRNE